MMKQFLKFIPIVVAIPVLVFVLMGAKSDTTNNQKLILQNGTLINPKTKTVSSMNILIEGETITEVSNSKIESTEAKVIDLQGKFILPGLIDSHIHPAGNAGANKEWEFLGTQGTVARALQSGVVAVLDVFSNEAENIPFRDTQDKTMGADFYTSASCFTATKGHCTEYRTPTRTIDTPEEAIKSVTELIETKKPNVIKIVYDDAFANIPGGLPTIDQPTMEAAVKTANKFGVKTIIHIGTWDNAKKALVAGATAITHVACSPVPQDVVDLMAEKNAYFIPTMVVQTEILNKSENPDLWSDKLATRVISEKILDEFNAPESYHAGVKQFQGYQERCAPYIMDNVSKISNAGVKTLAGTDVPNLGTFIGYSLHREMFLLTQAGLSKWDALRSTTTYGAEFLDQKYGVETGDIASLVVLNSSPLDNIQNTMDIFNVIHRGQLVNLLKAN